VAKSAITVHTLQIQQLNKFELCFTFMMLCANSIYNIR